MIFHSYDCESHKGDLCNLEVKLQDIVTNAMNSSAATTEESSSGLYPDGTSLKIHGLRNKETFYVEDGMRRSIPDWEFFLCMKFELSKVISLTESAINAIPLGSPLQV